MNRMFSTQTMSSIVRQLKLVQDKIHVAATKRPQHLQYFEPCLVAASKTRGVDTIIETYDAGQRHFGENYVVELHEKANDIELQDRTENIRWHLIGHLQRNKVSKVLDVPNLYMVESVDSPKLAKALNDGWGRMKKAEPLRVMAQCNTSREENKSGCAPEEMVALVRYIQADCPHLRLAGLMTIGAYDFDCSTGPNPDFQALVSIREEVCQGLNLSTQDLDLSMGMSSDYEHAVEVGSSMVRVGTAIFGPRSYPTKATPQAQSSPPTKDNTSTTSTSDDSPPTASTSTDSVSDASQQLKDVSIS